MVQTKAEGQGLDLRPNGRTGEKPLLILQPKGICPDPESPKHLIPKFPSALNTVDHIVLYLHLYITYIFESFLLWSIGSIGLWGNTQ